MSKKQSPLHSLSPEELTIVNAAMAIRVQLGISPNYLSIAHDEAKDSLIIFHKVDKTLITIPKGYMKRVDWFDHLHVQMQLHFTKEFDA